MTYNPKVQFIPARPPQREARVGIYSRVCSNSLDQLNSIASQISALTRMVASVPKWLLVDIYIDIASSKTGSSRKEFNRMLEDCKNKNLEIIITKNISRFGRDTVEVLEALHQLRLLGIRVIFEDERDIVWVKFTKDGYIGVVAVSNDINFDIPESKEEYIKKTEVYNNWSKQYEEKWQHNTSGIIVHYLKKYWEDTFVLLFPLKNIPEGLTRGVIESGIGNYLIDKKVPILDFYSHNY